MYNILYIAYYMYVECCVIANVLKVKYEICRIFQNIFLLNRNKIQKLFFPLWRLPWMLREMCCVCAVSCKLVAIKNPVLRADAFTSVCSSLTCIYGTRWTAGMFFLWPRRCPNFQLHGIFSLCALSWCCPSSSNPASASSKQSRWKRPQSRDADFLPSWMRRCTV